MGVCQYLGETCPKNYRSVENINMKIMYGEDTAQSDVDILVKISHHSQVLIV